MSMIGNCAEVTSAQLQTLLADPSAVVSFIYSEDENRPVAQLDLDKAWHGIHFLLTGEVWGGSGPQAMAVLGGTAIGEDVGYGPARYLTSEEVKAVAGALSSIDRDKLHERYLPTSLEQAQVYPSGIWEDEGEEAFEWLVPWYEQLVAFYKRAAENGNAVLLYIN
jgi:hypothetical protein